MLTIATTLTLSESNLMPTSMTTLTYRMAVMRCCYLISRILRKCCSLRKFA